MDLRFGSSGSALVQVPAKQFAVLSTKQHSILLFETYNVLCEMKYEDIFSFHILTTNDNCEKKYIGFCDKILPHFQNCCARNWIPCTKKHVIYILRRLLDYTANGCSSSRQQ